MEEEKKNAEVTESVNNEKKDEVKADENVKKADKTESDASMDKTAKEPEKEKIEEKEEMKVSEEENIVESAKTKVPANLLFYPEIRNDIPEIRPGDVVKVSYRVVEGGKERIQLFEGIVIAIKNSGIAKTVTVRKTSYGISIERIFPLNSKLVQKIEVKKHSKVRRAKLYYLRKLKGKAARLKELR